MLTQYIIQFWKLDYVNASKLLNVKILTLKHLLKLIEMLTYLKPNDICIITKNHFIQGSPVDGVNMVIILKRRLINEILTTYLPTCQILSIVYATNFFKPFFFEAVVTVNLTALLVLTTLFISVSGHMFYT